MVEIAIKGPIDEVCNIIGTQALKYDEIQENKYLIGEDGYTLLVTKILPHSIDGNCSERNIPSSPFNNSNQIELGLMSIDYSVYLRAKKEYEMEKKIERRILEEWQGE